MDLFVLSFEKSQVKNKSDFIKIITKELKNLEILSHETYNSTLGSKSIFNLKFRVNNPKRLKIETILNEISNNIRDIIYGYDYSKNFYK